MTPLERQGVYVFIGIVALALAEAIAYDVVMYLRLRDMTGSISSGMGALGHHHPAAAVLIGAGLVALVVGLIWHFWFT